MKRSEFLKLKIESHITPVLMTYPSGSRAAIFPGTLKGVQNFFEIGMDIQMEDLLSVWKRTVPEKNPNADKVQEWKVKGSKNNIYTVSLKQGFYKCTCTGFGFRRKCKHVDSIKNIAQ